MLFVAELCTAPLLFFVGVPLMIIGMALCGISVGTQESILKAAIGEPVAEEVLARAFGALWFGGSAISGALYDAWGSVPLVIFSVVFQGASCVLFSVALRRDAADRR